MWSWLSITDWCRLPGTHLAVIARRKAPRNLASNTTGKHYPINARGSRSRVVRRCCCRGRRLRVGHDADSTPTPFVPLAVWCQCHSQSPLLFVVHLRNLKTCHTSATSYHDISASLVCQSTHKGDAAIGSIPVGTTTTGKPDTGSSKATRQGHLQRIC